METFAEGQRWENPDGLCMNIVCIKDGYVHFMTDEGEFGKQTTTQMHDWLECGAIAKGKPQ